MNETRIEKRRKGGQDETSRCAHLAQFPRHWVCPSRRSALGKTAAVTWESRETIVRSLWQPAPALPSGQPGPAAHGFSSSLLLPPPLHCIVFPHSPYHTNITQNGLHCALFSTAFISHSSSFTSKVYAGWSLSCLTQFQISIHIYSNHSKLMSPAQ